MVVCTGITVLPSPSQRSFFAVLPISRPVLLAFQVDAVYTRIVWEATLDKAQQSQCVFLSPALLNQWYFYNTMSLQKIDLSFVSAIGGCYWLSLVLLLQQRDCRSMRAGKSQEKGEPKGDGISWPRECPVCACRNHIHHNTPGKLQWAGIQAEHLKRGRADLFLSCCVPQEKPHNFDHHPAK